MADGMNHVRALRLAEIMQDFRNIQQCIAQITATPSPQDHYSEGYQILEQCLSDSKAVLRAPFITSPSSSPQGDIEAEKEQLQRILLDASTRRFQAQRIYLRAAAALRWVQARNSILGRTRTAGSQIAVLLQLDMKLREEVSAIFDQEVVDNLRWHDQQLGRWTEEDSTLRDMLGWITMKQ